jgi:hypothetical protein
VTQAPLSATPSERHVDTIPPGSAWTGPARYYTVRARGQASKNAARYNPHPTPLARKIKNHMAVWRDCPGQLRSDVTGGFRVSSRPHSHRGLGRAGLKRDGHRGTEPAVLSALPHAARQDAAGT